MLVHLIITGTPFILCVLLFVGIFKTTSSQQKQVACNLNDRIVTHAGIYGIVIQKNTSTLILELYDGALVEIDSSAVAHVC